MVAPLFSKFSQLWRRLLFYMRRDRFDSELQEEMRFHLEMKAQENIEAGVKPEEARYAERSMKLQKNCADYYKRQRSRPAIPQLARCLF